MTIKEKIAMLKQIFGVWFYVGLTVDIGIIALVLYLLFA